MKTHISFLMLIGVVWVATSCTSDDKGDSSPPQPVLVSPVEGDTVAGEFNITWISNDDNPSSAKIELSADGGQTYQTITSRTPDTGSYLWKTFAQEENFSNQNDGDSFRLRLTLTDVPGNVSEPVESGIFSTDNAPRVIGPALFHDLNTNGTIEVGDKITLRFNQAVTINGASNANFFLPVAGDSIGSVAPLLMGAEPEEVDIPIGNGASLNARGQFDPLNTRLNSASGIDVGSLTATLIVSAETGVRAKSAGAVDIVPVYISSIRNPILTGQAADIAMADLDSDGALDLVVAVDGVDEFWKNVDGAFIKRVPRFPGTTPPPLPEYDTTALVTADLDKDSYPDIVFGTRSSGVHVWTAPFGDFLFSAVPQAQLNDLNDEIADLITGDFNNNGNLDLVVGINGVNTLWRNDGLGNFQMSPDFSVEYEEGIDQAADTREIKAADLDKDGDLDLVIGNFQSPNVLWINQSEPGAVQSFRAVPLADGAPSDSTTSIALGDIDHDSDIDIVVGNEAEPDSVWENQGEGTFLLSSQPQISVLSAETQSLELGDIDGDGDLDIVSVNLDGSNPVWVNSGEGQFVRGQRSLSGQAGNKVVLRDINQNGSHDVMMAHPPQGISLWLNSLTAVGGKFPRFEKLELNSPITLESFGGMSIGDINNDAQLDIVVTDQSGFRSFSVLPDGATREISQPNSVPIDYFLGSNSLSKLVDLNNDGALDLVFAGINPDQRVWLNDKTGVFTSHSHVWPLPISPSEVDVGDMNRDGHVDIVFSQPSGFGTSVWLNDGNGIFDDPPILFASGDGNEKIHLADLNRTGSLDVVMISSSRSTLYLNCINEVQNPPDPLFYRGCRSHAGADQFQAAGGDWQTIEIVPNSSGSSINSMATADINNNGIIDAVFGNSDVAPNSVWEVDGAFNVGGVGAQRLEQSFLDSTFVSTREIVLGDLDNDGYEDMVATNDGQAIAVWQNQSGIFVPTNQPNLDADLQQSGPIILVDFDRDGDLDFISLGRVDQDLSIVNVWLNQ